MMKKNGPAISTPLNLQISENRPVTKINQDDCATDATIAVKREVPSPVPSCTSSIYTLNRSSASDVKSSSIHGAQKVNAWARKQRKFKCDLCPSSFKRSSHLSRHQLVHTGERPYSCNQCEKAFSRHDKLKHHIRKAHEFIPDSMFERLDVEEPNESELDASNRNYASLIQNGSVSTGASSTSSAVHSFQRENSPLFTISHITSILEDSFVTPPKKGRGRPRKYPPAPPQPIKRSRGRPRLNQAPYVAPRPGVQNYDITNLPYGDLNYLTGQSNHRPEEATVLEPLVEINTGQIESSKNITTNQVNVTGDRLDSRSEDGINYMEHTGIEPLVQIQTQSLEEDKSSIKEDIVNISEIETKIGLIGECTISVAN
ncbi:hypothetical protein WA026_000291 [Henosepilachna vigintioctopunctata]|uniref:C2H2-type domain-containing protein n=1 Tax=Henosepilachna vigintioctopunctata TaxID=420089 RepID=A0AAW1V4N9_9CUCU